MPVPFPIMDNENIKYQVPTQIKTYLCNYCNKQTDSLRWIEKFREEHFKCDDCWKKTLDNF